MELCKECHGRGRLVMYKPKMLSVCDPEMAAWEAADTRSMMAGNGTLAFPHHLMREEVEADCRCCDGRGFTGEIEP